MWVWHPTVLTGVVFGKVLQVSSAGYWTATQETVYVLKNTRAIWDKTLTSYANQSPSLTAVWNNQNNISSCANPLLRLNRQWRGDDAKIPDRKCYLASSPLPLRLISDHLDIRPITADFIKRFEKVTDHSFAGGLVLSFLQHKVTRLLF